MYYDNKSSFYIRQYGPTVLIVVISFLLIGSGLYIYISSNHTAPKSEIVAEAGVDNKNVPTENEVKIELTTQDKQSSDKDNIVDNTTKVDEKIENKVEVSENNIELVYTESLKDDNVSTVSSLSNELSSLRALQKSSKGTVKNVDKNGNVYVEIDYRTYNITLIGVDFKKSPSSVYEQMEKDLKGKTVAIAFDKLKEKDSKIYAYIYIGSELYNQTLLNEGLASLKVERTNISLLDILLEAQLYAKSNSIGIWKKIN